VLENVTNRLQLFLDLEILNFTLCFVESLHILTAAWTEALLFDGGFDVWLNLRSPLAYRDKDPFLSPFSARQIRWHREMTTKSHEHLQRPVRAWKRVGKSSTEPASPQPFVSEHVTIR
jgi:hypothetical protein